MNRSQRRVLAIKLAIIMAIGPWASPCLALAVDEDAPKSAAKPALAPSEQEKAMLRAQFEGLSVQEREEMSAYYKALGIDDLPSLLGISERDRTEQGRTSALVEALKELSRSHGEILAARTSLATDTVLAQPHPSLASTGAIAAWIRLRVVGAEWSPLGDYLRLLPKRQGDEVFSAILRALKPDTCNLLPEEVIALGECAPSEPNDDQLSLLAGLLRSSSQRNTTAPMLEALRSSAAESRRFGTGSTTARVGTLKLLSKAGLVEEASEYLPPLEDARAQRDARVILDHARYRRFLSETLVEGVLSEERRSIAWALYEEASLLADAPLDVRRDAIDDALGLAHRMPRAKVQAWFTRLFADQPTAALSLERIALKAAALRDAGTGSEALGGEDRLRLVVTLKEAMDQVLASGSLGSEALRVPLRTLTASLLAELDAAFEARAAQLRSGNWYGRTDDRFVRLLPVLPGPDWLAALEPSLALRASITSFLVAIQARNMDRAGQALGDACSRAPQRARDLTDQFLEAWERTLRSREYWYDQNGTYIEPSDLVTRGQQRRTLDQLRRVLDICKAHGRDPSELRHLSSAFQAIHRDQELLSAEDIERVFGPIEKMPASASRDLAEQLRASIAAFWRNKLRPASQPTLTARSPASANPPQALVPASPSAKGTTATAPPPSNQELVRQTQAAYDTAMRLIDSSLAVEPTSWRAASIRASIRHDRLRFDDRRDRQRSADPSKRELALREVFAAFRDAARVYAGALGAENERESPEAFVRWFNAAMGASDLHNLVVGELPGEGSLADAQVPLIAGSLRNLPEGSRDRIEGAFAREIADAFTQAAAEAKPRLLAKAMQIVGDHPEAAALREKGTVYRELIDSEVKLRLTIDGPPEVGVGQSFGVLLTLRSTSAAERENNFSMYLQDDYHIMVDGVQEEVDFRERLRETLARAFAAGFDVEDLQPFHPFTQSRVVIEGDQTGWVEKPLAYAVLRARDLSPDHLPPVSMDMWFRDGSGEVVLAARSNTPPLRVLAEAPPRPASEDTRINVLIDARTDQHPDARITAEVRVRSTGLAPRIQDVLAGLDDAIDGCTTVIEDRGVTVLSDSMQTSKVANPWGYTEIAPLSHAIAPGSDGLFRPLTERVVNLTYTPKSGARGDSFRVPTLKDGAFAELQVSRYIDMDISPVTGPTIRIVPKWWTLSRLALAIGAVVLAICGAVVWRRRVRARPVTPPTASAMPQRVTPVSAIVALRRLQQANTLTPDRKSQLDLAISDLERRSFARSPAPPSDDEVASLLSTWLTDASRA